MESYRITRHDPSERDERGAVIGQHWTAVSDVGSTFAGQPLTLAAYYAVENAYAFVAATLAEAARVERLIIVNLEFSSVALPREEAAYEEGDELPLLEALDVLRLMLREHLHCRLEAPADGFQIHVGYDFYMYVQVPEPLSNPGELSSRTGLFLEPGITSGQGEDDER